jgi:hypothetical protein
MSTTLFTQFSSAIRNFDGTVDTPGLQLAASGPLAAYYAPFDALNVKARVVLVGITPGRSQASNALAEARKQLANGASPEEALRQAKRIGAFSGAMRSNLTAMLDHIGLQRWLGLGGCDELFDKAGHLLQSASVLPFPVFVNGDNYNGTPDPITTPMLRQLVLAHPSGANAERIHYFLGKKPASLLSAKTNPGKLDNVRFQLQAAVALLT